MIMAAGASEFLTYREKGLELCWRPVCYSPHETEHAIEELGKVGQFHDRGEEAEYALSPPAKIAMCARAPVGTIPDHPGGP